MNLSELADFICIKVNQSETDDKVACKSFLTRRMQMIWNVALWKDSLAEYTATLSPTGYTVSSTWLPARGVLLLPKDIERVVAVRTSERALNIQRPEYFYRIDYDSFAKSGRALEYILLPPAVWQTNDRERILITADEAADNDAVNVVDVMAADGITVERLELTATQIAAQDYTTDIVLAWGKPQTEGTMELLVDSAGVVQLTSAASAAPKRQRVRLVEIPTAEVAIRVLGKRACPTFTNNLDVPALAGVENCLLAFAQADMLQRERQYGKARELQQEAIGLLDQLKDLEVVQQAHHVQITPGAGLVSEWQFNSGAYYPLTF